MDASTPIEVITEHTCPRAGVIVHEERIADDEITFIGELPLTTPARTALDLAFRAMPRSRIWTPWPSRLVCHLPMSSL